MATLLAYGSLMWDNVLATYPGEKVTVDGLSRAFVGESRSRWGTPEHPCPQIGLLPGSDCAAVLFHVAMADRRRIVRSLRQREGTKPTKVLVRSADGRTHRAPGFLPTPDARGWSNREELIDAVRRARGVVGTGAEYVRTLIHAMELWGVEDPVVEDVWNAVRN